MPVTINGSGPIAGASTLNGLTIPTTGFGKVLQVVRAIDTTERTTTSTSFVDVTGVSVTITPQRSNSAIILICNVNAYSGANFIWLALTDSSNTLLNATNGAEHGVGTGANYRAQTTLMAYVTPNTTSAVTYKLRFRANAGTVAISGNNIDSQIYAIEVSA